MNPFFSISFLVFALSIPAAAADCPTSGRGGDTALSALKNRTEFPGSFIQMPVRAFLTSTPSIHSKQNRLDKIPADELAKIDSANSRCVALTGVLVAMRPDGPAASNCYSQSAHEVQLWVASETDSTLPKASLKSLQAKSVIVATTPYWQQQHGESWTEGVLGQFVKARTKVRVSGWVLFNPEHPGQVGKLKVTPWEIHPVTKIEIWSEGEWREL